MPKLDSSQMNGVILEGLLFAQGGPMTAAALGEALGWSGDEIERAVATLREALVERGLQVLMGADGYELGVAPEIRKQVAQALQLTAQPLSQSALEVLTVVAYRQPVAKVTIDELRGVASDASLKTLLARDLIVSAGQKDGATQYRTTNHFLKSLGLKSLDDLPEMKGKL